MLLCVLKASLILTITTTSPLASLPSHTPLLSSSSSSSSLLFLSSCLVCCLANDGEGVHIHFSSLGSGRRRLGLLLITCLFLFRSQAIRSSTELNCESVPNTASDAAPVEPEARVGRRIQQGQGGRQDSRRTSVHLAPRWQQLLPRQVRQELLQL